MNRLLYLFAFLCIAFNGYCQINPADSTVQVIGYWDKNEAHTYTIEYKKYKLKAEDTITTQNYSYKVDIIVTDSTESSYTVQWKYRDFTSKNSNNISFRAAALANGLTVKFKTNEIGEYQELLNWKEVDEHYKNGLKLLQKDKEIPQYIINLLATANRRETVEDVLLKDIAHFYAFYGHSMGLGEEISDVVDEKNEFGAVVKSDVYLTLDEIDFEEESFLLKFYQTYDDETIVGALGSAFKELAGNDAEELKNTIKVSGLEDYYGTYMHNSGWPFSLYYERSMQLNGDSVIESRFITLD
ncbi:MAG: hypothetical protein V4581_16920 [Bacteroidota bacterium]